MAVRKTYKVDIPIFIPAKCETPEQIRQNKVLLPFAYHYLNKHQLLRNTVVLSDSQDFLDYAVRLGFNKTYLEKCVGCKQCRIQEKGILHYMHDTGTDAEWFIIYSLRRPFKGENLILDVVNKINDNYDFVTTYSIRTDRAMFYIGEDKKFVEDVEVRNPDRCKHYATVDSALFCMKKQFLYKVATSKNPDNTLWEGRFKTVLNKGLYYDMCDDEDFVRIEKVAKVIEEVREYEASM